MEEWLLVPQLRRAWPDWLGLNGLVPNLVAPGSLRLSPGSLELVLRRHVVWLVVGLWSLVPDVWCENRIVVLHLSVSLRVESEHALAVLVDLRV